MTPTEIFLLTLNCNEFLRNIVVRNNDKISIESATNIINENRTSFRDEGFDSRLIKGFAFCFHDYVEEKANVKFPISKTDRYIIKDQTKRLLQSAIYIIDNNEYQAKVLQLLDLIKADTLDEEIAKFMQIKGVGIVKAKKMKKAGVKTLSSFIGSPNKYKK